MDRLIATNSVPSGSADTAPVSGTPQFATTGAPGGLPPTQFPAYQYNAIQEEIVGTVLAAGIALDRTNNAQLASAIAILARAQTGNIAGETAISDANFTITPAYFGQRILLNPGATANRNFTLDDGLKVGDSIRVGSSTTGVTLNLNIVGGSAAHFFGLNFAGVSTIPLQGGQEVWAHWTGSNWHIDFFTGVFATANNIGSLAIVTSASQLTQGTSYTGGTFTGFGLSGNWVCITSGGPASGLYFSLIYRMS